MPANPIPGRTGLATLGLLLGATAQAAQDLPLPPAQAAVAATAEASPRHYDIPAGPLDEVLTRFARQAGITLSFTPDLVAGRRSPGLAGRHGVASGLAAVLEGTGRGVRALSPLQYVLLAAPVPAPPPATPRVGPATAGAAAATAVQQQLLPTVTVRAARDLRQDAYDTPAAVAVITREDIDRLPPRNTSDVLAEVAGLSTSQGRQSPGVSVNLRGMQDFGRVNVMIDGTRQNFQRSGHGANGAVYLDPELLGGVDIAKGPSSTVGGAGMIAGSVNFRTLEADDLLTGTRRQGYRTNATTGSNAYDFSGSLAGAWRVGEGGSVLAALGRKQVNQFDWGTRHYQPALPGMPPTSLMTGQDQWSALLKAAWRLAPDQQLKLSYIGLDARFSEGARTADEIATTGHNRLRSDTLLLNHHWQPALPGVDLRSSLYATRTRNDQRREPSAALGLDGFQLRYQTDTVGGTLENTARLPRRGPGAGPDLLLLKAGGEFFHDRTRPQAQVQTQAGPDAGAGTGDTGEPLWFTGATPAGRRTVASLFSELTALQGDWLEASAGLRYDAYALKGRGQMNVGRIANPAGVRPPTTQVYSRFSVNRHDGAFAPRLSLAVRPVAPLQLFANVGQGLRPPAITESLMWGMHLGNLFPYYPNPGLEAERSRTAELGANLTLADVLAAQDRLRLKSSWFDNRVKHYIVQARIMSPVSVVEGGIGPMAFVNLRDPARFRGLELQADYDAGHAFAALAFTRMLIDTGRGGYDPFPLGSVVGFPPTSLGQADGADIWYVLPPQRRVVLSGGLRLLDRRLTLGARLRDERPATNTSQWITANATPWRVLDLWAAWTLSPAATLRLSVENLRDEHYAEMNGTSYLAGPGRTVLLSVALKF